VEIDEQDNHIFGEHLVHGIPSELEQNGDLNNEQESMTPNDQMPTLEIEHWIN
jgi:hypothetical protein